ncbi:MAG: hypothetical protein CEO22_140 [Candidatus Berkelbacteria bacterium Gr01-1014_85]|uniref:RNA polymerase alpha subunit C-terminal domain-containing protein n=1 Tax=Candidatus Berkelbacteria bacterium Gr01-1014_85 TaxID=2017150 RepID=A0A554JD35_9BACT|nr:MAG: hypothetical protein CEO22_140 [Candidatus Berkelbacteria bacterium Gr01-1014_85]
MTTGESGRTSINSSRQAAKQVEDQRFRERLAGHEIDAYPEHLDALIDRFGFKYWYRRPVPQGRKPSYWRNGGDNVEEYCHDPWWDEHKNDEEYALARRQLFKLGFTYLNVREQLVIALWYGLLDGKRLRSTEKRTYVAEQMEIRKELAGQLIRHAMAKLQRVCSIIADNPNRLEPVNAGPNAVLEVLGFSTRTYNCLHKAEFRTLKDLRSAEELLNIRGFGRQALIEVCQKLRQYGQPLPQYAEHYIDIEKL